MNVSKVYIRKGTDFQPGFSAIGRVKHFSSVTNNITNIVIPKINTFKMFTFLEERIAVMNFGKRISTIGSFENHTLITCEITRVA